MSFDERGRGDGDGYAREFRAESSERPRAYAEPRGEVAKAPERQRAQDGLQADRLFRLPTKEQSEQEDALIVLLKGRVESLKADLAQADAAFNTLHPGMSGVSMHLNADHRLVPRADLVTTQDQLAAGVIRPKEKRGLAFFRGQEYEPVTAKLPKSVEQRQAYQSAKSLHETNLAPMRAKLQERETQLLQLQRQAEFRTKTAPEFCSPAREAARRRVLEEFESFAPGLAISFAENEVVAAPGDGGSVATELQGSGLQNIGLHEADRAEVLRHTVPEAVRRKFMSTARDGGADGPAAALGNPNLPLVAYFPNGVEERSLYVHEGPFTVGELTSRSMKSPKLKARVRLQKGQVVKQEVF